MTLPAWGPLPVQEQKTRSGMMISTTIETNECSFSYLRGMRRLPFIILAFLSLMVSCSRGDRELAAGFLLADSLMEANPDSGLAYLQGLKGQAEKSSKADRYRYQLLLAKAMNKAYAPFTSDSVMKDVAQYYDRHGSPNERMMAHYLLGCVYRDLDSLPQALLQYEEAISQADTISEDCDFKTLGRIYGQAAEAYYESYMPQNTLEASWNHIRYGLRAKDSVGVISGYDFIADAYSLMGKEDSEIYYHEKASRLYEKHQMLEEAAMSLGALIETYTKRKDLKNASRCLHRYERESGLFDGKGNIVPGREIFYYGKGLYFLNTGAIDSATFYFRKLKNKKQSTFNERRAAVIGLYQTYQKLGMTDSVAHYASLKADYANDILNKNMKTSTSRVSASYKQQQLTTKVKEKESETKNAEHVGYFLIVLALVAIYLVSIKIRKEKKGAKQKEAQYEQEKNSLTNKQRKLQALLVEHEEKSQQIFAQKQEQINQLLSRVEAISGPADMAEVERRIRHAAITEKFRQLCHGNQRPSVDDWHELREMMNKELPNFYQTVNARTALQLDEYDICVLVRLRFKPKEIAFLANINSGYVSVIRKRLLLKVFGETGSASDFDREIQKIYR